MPGNFDELTGTARLSDDDSVTYSSDKPGGHAVAIPVASDDVNPESDALGTRTPRQIREVAKELTRYGLIEAARKPNLYRVLQNQRRALAAILEPLDLDLTLDDIRGLAFVTVRTDAADSEISIDEETDPDEWSHPLVRRQRLTLEQSLLVAILRQHFVAHEQESGIGADDARVAIDELIPQFQIYLGDPGSEAKERTRMLTLLDQLKGQGLVSEPDTHERVTIRPIIAHLASPENLQHLLAWLRERRTGISDKTDVATDVANAGLAIKTGAKPEPAAGIRAKSNATSVGDAGVMANSDAVSAEGEGLTSIASAASAGVVDKPGAMSGAGQTGELFED